MSLIEGYMETRKRSQSAIHWEYFIGLETDFLKSARYVDFTEAHRDVYSQFFTQMLVSAASEFESVSKAIAEISDFDHSCKDMTGIEKLYRQKDAEFTTCWLQTLVGDHDIRPFADWASDAVLGWWGAYTNVKHKRHINMEFGSLHYALHAMGGLYLANMCLAYTEGGESESRTRNRPSGLFAVVSIHNSDRIDHYSGKRLMGNFSLSKRSVEAYMQ